MGSEENIPVSSGKGRVTPRLAPTAFGADQLTCTNATPELGGPEQGPWVRDKQLPCRGAVGHTQAPRADLNLSLRKERTAEPCGGSSEGTAPAHPRKRASWCQRDNHTAAVQSPEQPREAQRADAE